MDVILSSKPQTLSLIPCTPLSSFFSYNLRSIRRDFLGRAHALRPPAGTLRSRRRQSKPGLRVQSSRFLFRASLKSHSSVLVVVAVVTFSAVSVVLFNRFRRKKNDREVSGPPNFALLELGQDVMNWVFGGQILGFGELHKGKERNRLRDKIGESSHASEDEEGPLLLRNSALIDEEVLVTKTLLPPGSDVLTSITSDYSDTNGPVFDSCAVQPLTFAKEMTALQVEGPEEGIASDLELPTLKDNIELNGASVNINNSPAEVNAYNKANNEPAEEGKTVSDNVFLGESVREELYIFYEANESVTQSVASSSTLKSFSKHASVLNRNSALIDEEVLVTKTLLPPGSDVLTSSSSDYSDTNGPVFDSCAVQPLTFAKEMTALQVEGPEEEIASDLELPTLKDNIELNGASVNINNSPAEVNAYNKANNEPAEEGKTVSDNVFLGESVREELYIFYEANESVTQSMASSSTLKSFSKRASVLNSNKYSSSLRTSALRGAELSAQVSLQTAEHVQGKLPISCYKEGLPHRRRDSGKVNGFPRDREIRDMPQDSYKNFPQFPHPSRMQVTDKKHPSEQLCAYNRLLKEGRLTQCVELLEDMERSGLLDMNKVYHVKFFEKCKGQKAVKEAFRYAKLIPNPTLSTFNMLVSVCGSSQDSEGAFRVLPLVQEAGLKADCKLYTTLISTCAKSGKVDAMFEVFHKMVNAGVEPNVNTYGALIDGCARAGQVAKAFGAYGIMRSKKVKPDRVVFNALITACGQSGAVDRAFDVLAEMGAETQPIDPDHVTIGALIKACANAGQVDRAREVYKMIHQYHIKGTPDVYTIAVNCCSQTGDWEFACSVYNDMTRNGVVPDEMFLSALIDAAGHAGKLDAAFEILQKARVQGIQIGIVSYSSLMGACSNVKNWQKALELYEDLKSMKTKQTISTVNALITALCDGDQLPKAMEVLSEMKELGLSPNSITYSILLVASEKKDDLEAGLMVLSQAKKDGIIHNLVMFRCIVGMCLRRFEEACKLGEPVLSFDSGQPHVDNKGTSVALMMYRETIVSGVMPTNEVLSQVLGCLQFPCDASVKDKLIENLGVSGDTSRCSNLCSLIDGFGEYDPRAFSLVEEAASLGIVPCVSFKASPIVVDVRNLETHTAEVYLLTVLKGLKHRLAAGAKLPNITILLSVDETNFISPKGERTINLSGRASQAVAALLRRLGLQYQGNESYGKIRINGLSLRRWFQPKLTSPFSGKPGDWSSSQSRLGKGIIHQQRNIRTGNLSLD